MAHPSLNKGFGLLLVASTAVHGWSTLGATPTPVAPRCDLQQLNDAYIRRVTSERQRVDPGAPPAHFDRNLLAGTVAFSQLLERNDTLYHDNTRYAELVGTFLDADPTTPAQVAQLVYERLRASAYHCEIQADAGLTGICLSATRRSYVLRLSRAPAADNPARHQRRRAMR